MKTFIIPLSNGEAGKPIEISIKKWRGRKTDFLNYCPWTTFIVTEKISTIEMD